MTTLSKCHRYHRPCLNQPLHPQHRRRCRLHRKGHQISHHCHLHLHRLHRPVVRRPAAHRPSHRHLHHDRRRRHHHCQLIGTPTGVSADAFDKYIMGIYRCSREQLARLPRFDEVDFVYDHLLGMGRVNDAEFPGRCSDFRARPFRYGRAPHSPLVAWFYRPPPFTAVPSNTWTEITHCAGSEFEAHASWYYVVKGSGVFVNTGPTISFSSHGEAVRHFLGAGYCDDQQCNDAIRTALPEAARAAGIHSIQFLHHCDFDCDEPDNDDPPGRGNGNGCGHELMVIQTTNEGTALGTGGNRACPTGVEFRTGIDASQPCECTEDVPWGISQLRSVRGTCTACKGMARG